MQEDESLSVRSEFLPENTYSNDIRTSKHCAIMSRMSPTDDLAQALYSSEHDPPTLGKTANVMSSSSIRSNNGKIWLELIRPYGPVVNALSNST